MLFPDRHFHRTGRIHLTKNEFRLTGGPSIEHTGDTSASVRWTMSEVCGAYIEWGTASASYTNTTTAASISDGYAEHFQTISLLQPGVTHYFRTVSTSAAGVVVRSSEQSFMTTGSTQPVGVGVRYGRATWPERSATVWPALPASYVLVPAMTTSDHATELATWLNDRANVPNGTPGAPTYVVFDRTLLGDGTTYTISHSVLLGINSTLTHDIVFWAYGAKFRMAAKPVGATSQDYPHVIFRRGGFESCEWLGGEIHGPNVNSHDYDTRSGGNELNHGIELRASWQDFTIADVYIHDVWGDGIQINALDPSRDATQGTLFGEMGAPADLDIGYCYISGTGRQGVVIDQGTRVTLHHSVVEYTAILCVDSEGMDYISSFNVLIDLEISDNVFRYWECHFPVPDSTGYSQVWDPAAISFNHRTTNEIQPGALRNFTITRNLFSGGAYGYGNPVAEAYFRTLGWTGKATDGYGQVIRWRLPGISKTNMVVTANTFDLPADQDRNRSTSTYLYNGNAVVIDAVVGLTITGNDFGNRGIYYRTATGTVTISDITGIIDA